MQFGVAARQVDRIGRRAGHLVGERREERQFGPLPAPALQDCRVGEAEGIVARDGDALPERRQRGERLGAGELGRTRERDQPVDVETRRHRLRRACDDGVGRHRLARRNQPEMAFGQHQVRVLHHGAEAGKIGQVARHRASSTARWRGPATRLKITPASGSAGSCRAKPATSAAAEAP